MTIRIGRPVDTRIESTSGRCWAFEAKGLFVSPLFSAASPSGLRRCVVAMPTSTEELGSRARFTKICSIEGRSRVRVRDAVELRGDDGFDKVSHDHSGQERSLGRISRREKGNTQHFRLKVQRHPSWQRRSHPIPFPLSFTEDTERWLGEGGCSECRGGVHENFHRWNNLSPSATPRNTDPGQSSPWANQLGAGAVSRFAPHLKPRYSAGLPATDSPSNLNNECSA